MQRFCTTYFTSNIAKNLKILGLRTLFLAVFLFSGIASGDILEARAQGTAQVVLTGIPPVLSSPYISDLERSYEQGLFATQFIYVSPGRQPQTFRFRLTLEINGQVMLEMVSEPNQYEPGIHVYRTFDDEPAIRFPLGYGEIIERLNASVDQNGILPEGDYVLTIEPVVEDELAIIPTVPGMAFFNVRYAEPPLLLTPFDQSSLTSQFPVFNWTPVTGAPLTSTFEYEFTVVEVFPGQAAYQALESNIPLVREGLVAQTSFVYTMNEMPLEEGKQYVWQVRARDVNDQMPVLERGETEFWTFNVGQGGLGSMLTSWSFPVSSPFLIYDFEGNTDLDPADTEIFIDGRLPIELLGLDSEAQFDKLLIDAETQSIIEGQVVIPTPLTIEVAINPLSDDLSGYTAVAGGSSLSLTDGLLLSLGRNVRIDANGMHPRGTHNAIVSYAGLPENEWTATYSSNFTFGFAPFGIRQGRVDFASNGVARAYADATGFHLIDQSDPVIAQLPDRLQLPDDDIAFVALKRDGISLVDIEPAARGQYILREKPGAPLELTLPGVRYGQQGPQFIAALEDVVIDAQTGQLISGTVTASPSEGAGAFTLDAIGLPIAPTELVTRSTPNGTSLDITGRLSIFGKPVENAAPVTFSIDETGFVSGDIALEEEDAYIFLDGPAGNVSLDIASASGAIRLPLNAFTSGQANVAVSGRFNIHRGDFVVAAADVAFTYDGEGPVRINAFEPVPNERASRPISLDSFWLEVEKISSLDLFYSHQAGLTYVADLNANLQLFQDASSPRIPLQGVELHQNKFYVPQQESHADVAGFTSFKRNIGPAEMSLLAYRIPRALVSRKSENGPTYLTPQFDFEVRLKDLPGIPQTVSDLPLTLQNAQIKDGIIKGKLIPYTVREGNLVAALNAGSLQIERLAGEFTSSEGQQDLDLQLMGTLSLVSALANDATPCLLQDMNIQLGADGSMRGASSPFTPCTAYAIGPVAANFSEAVLEIATSADSSFAVLHGTVDGFQRTGSRRTTDASGQLSLDVINGIVLEADVEADQLVLEFPASAPAFQVNAEQAHLSTDGFLLASDSTVSIRHIESNTTYQLSARNEFRLGLKPFTSNKGRAELVNADTRAGTFDKSGFRQNNPAPLTPQRILLPGSFGAYIDVTSAGEDGIQLTDNKTGWEIATQEDDTAQLIIPGAGTSGRDLQIPIAFELALDQSLAYLSGSFEQDLSDAPVSILGAEGSVDIIQVLYDGEAQSLELSAEVSVPAFLSGSDGSNEAIETTFVVDAIGLTSKSVSGGSFSFYEDALLASIDELQVRRGNRLATLIMHGRLDSPVLNHAGIDATPLRFTSVYEASNDTWQIDAISPASRALAIDQGTLFIDPLRPPAIKTDPALVVELSGILAMPAPINSNFRTEVALEIGPGGIYVWQSNAPADPVPFFNGFLTAYVNAVDIFYDATAQTLVTTVDGDFSPAITANQNPRGSNEPIDLLPFSGLELSTNGTVALQTSTGRLSSSGSSESEQETLPLLDGLPRISVIAQHFWIEELMLRTPGKGLLVEVQGSVRLPTPDGRRRRVTSHNSEVEASSTTSDRIPVSIVLNSDGQLLDLDGNPWNAALIQPGNPIGSDATTSTVSSGFNFTAASLGFNPYAATKNHILTASKINLPASAGSPVTDSTAVSSDAPNFLLLGDPFAVHRNPGLIVAQDQPQQYLLSDDSSPALRLTNPLFETDIRTVTIPDPEVLTLELAGMARLAAGQIQGYFPLSGITLNANGTLSDYGNTSGPTTLRFADTGVFEAGCARFRNIARAGASASPNGSVQFGAICGDSLGLTLTDKHLAGNFVNLRLQAEANGQTKTDITGAEINLGAASSLTANLSYTSQTPDVMTIEGRTTYQGVDLRSSGVLAREDGQTRLSVQFSPASSSISMLDGRATGTIAGGGIYLNPSEEDLSLIQLVLNERNNSNFSANSPEGLSLASNQIGLLLPLEVAIRNQDDALVLSGAGLLQQTSQFTTLDIDGAYFGLDDQLTASLYLTAQDEGKSLQGVSEISLNYNTIAGGIVKANFEAVSNDASLAWSAYGRSDVDVTDTIRLPGRFMLSPDGLLLDLYDATHITAGPISLHNDLNLTLWSDNNRASLNGYTAFDAEYELIPGFSLASTKLHGAIIEDREEFLLYAARNIFADVPFVYTGPIDPWISFQDGAIYGGDARNTTFRRMITDARQSGNAIPVHAEEATAQLRTALNVQQDLVTNLVRSENLPYFAHADSLLKLTGDQLLQMERAGAGEDDLPTAFESVAGGLFDSGTHPDYQQIRNVAAPNLETAAALQTMRDRVGAARRSAQSDMFALGGLLPRPLLWNSDYFDLDNALSTSPLTSIKWPGQDEDELPGFEIDVAQVGLHNTNLLGFKQGNEGLDVQFLRTIGGTELNLVNLKIARSGQQAIDFNSATSTISRYHAMHIASDWEMLRWTEEKVDWLDEQETDVDRAIRENLKSYEKQENSLDAIKDITRKRYDEIQKLALDTEWTREDLPEDQRFARYLNDLDEAALKDEFATTAKDLWFDVPMAGLTTLRDTLTSLIGARNERFETGMDSLRKSYGAFTLALDPLYDIQTKFTTTLYGMAEEYRNWRASIRRLDPEAVNYAFQFLPYRGNYRILAEDLIPPQIDEIRITSTSDGFLNGTTINWTAEHPVELTETSLALTFNPGEQPQFASLMKSPNVQFTTAKPDAATTEQDVEVTLRVRGAGGVPAVKRGQFSVAVDPASTVPLSQLSSPLITGDETPPPAPTISNLAYSSYFSETPNTLSFDLAPLQDVESGLAHIEYRVINDRDEEEVLQDWTELQKSTSYFSGRLVETSLPISEKDITVRVTVRATNEAGLTSEDSESLLLKLDDSEPIASIEEANFYNAFDLDYPNTVELALGEIRDEESGIDQIEYTIIRGAQASLADADWKVLQAFSDRDVQAGMKSVYINLDDIFLPEDRAVLSLYLRITNGAGLQSVVNQTLEIPGRDQSPPSEPVVALEHSGFYGSGEANQLRIIVSGSQDLESALSAVSYRVIDGKTGIEISGWDDFTFLNPNNPTFILPAIEKTVSLPNFESSRTIIVEVRTTNGAGLQSNNGVRFIEVNLDATPPTAPILSVRSDNNASPLQRRNLVLEIGPTQDPESNIDAMHYRIVSPTTQQPLTAWAPVLSLPSPVAHIPGASLEISSSLLEAGATRDVQVRVRNQEGLSSVVTQSLSITDDVTPPETSVLLLEPVDADDGNTSLNIYLGPAKDAESGIAIVRYQIKNLAFADSSLTDWQEIQLNEQSMAFAGKSVNVDLSGFTRSSSYRVDAEYINYAGLTTRVSGVLDQDTRLAYERSVPAAPILDLFYFDAQNAIRKNQLEVRIAPPANQFSVVDSVTYRYTIYDANKKKLTSERQSAWQTIAYSNARPDLPILLHIPVRAPQNAASASVDLRLMNENGASNIARTTTALGFSEDVTPPSSAEITYSYAGYHNAEAANELTIFIQDAWDAESRIADAAYRIVNTNNTNDVVIDWSTIPGQQNAGNFEATPVTVALPEFNRDRELNIEVRLTNGAGLESIAAVPFAITVDRTPPSLDNAELIITGVNNQEIEPALTIYPGRITDGESRITAVAYRVFTSSTAAAELVDWTPLDLIEGESMRFPPIQIAIPDSLLQETFTLEIEAQNEAGLSATSEQTIKASLDNSAPQMPRVEVSYQESELGTGFLLIEPGAFRDVESNIANLEYRLVDSNDPEFVLIDWINIPVPREVRVSVAPIAIPRDKIPFDGAVQLAVEFRATNGAGLFSTRRSTLELPGDVSPPEAPSLIVAHRNAYDPLHPNTVEIQIGSSEDTQSTISQAQYRIMSAASGEELTSWTQLPLSSEGYFPGTILFKELPLMESSTSLVVEVEVLNSAGLVNTIRQDVRIDIKNDATPPVTDISLHHFANEMALVLDELSDLESRIQKVEYRFLDNVDQSEIVGWTDLFEIGIPQDRYPRQSFKIKPPEVQADRTLKVEVRVTNGAGLQTTVSKTVLVRSPGSDQ